MNDYKSRYSNDLAGRALLCRDVIRSAGALVLSGFRQSAERGFSMKGPQDFLTETDAASEAHIRQAIAEHFPDDAFLGEEGGGTVADRVWVVDPVDGTANFARGIPHFCISIAYVEEGRAEIGAIYNPAEDELYLCRRGAGATLNGKPIKVSSTTSFDAASVEMGWSRRVPDETYLETMRLMLEKGANVRRGASGALALAYVADGRSDAYVELHMNAWDCLAGLLLVSEAGGAVCPFMEIGSLLGGGPVLASTPAIADGVSAASGIRIQGSELAAELQPA
ncbi:inositol monophosphatase (plasmid) [Ensifer adhaerens]|uniref:inositol monophosphatase family protein n=1 Tax=Ensifer adhaerens TaxID=106592 RepID=UPI0023AA0EFB|nr:inositol monophosphatase [Ensifer adhaerens]WDZ79274.1 inositol monophosphatase [Ensifer adhaerens]